MSVYVGHVTKVTVYTGGIYTTVYQEAAQGGTHGGIFTVDISPVCNSKLNV